MSRIGRQPVDIPAGVTVKLSDDNIISVKGPKGELTQEVNKAITVEVKDNQVTFARPNDKKRK